MARLAKALKLPCLLPQPGLAWSVPLICQQQNFKNEILPKVEEYTVNSYIPALTKVGILNEAEREKVAERVAYFSGIDQQEILNRNMSISTSFFWKEIIRDEKELTIGRLDSRYRGQDRETAGNYYDYDPALTSWNHAFTPAINHYLRNEYSVMRPTCSTGCLGRFVPGIVMVIIPAKIYSRRCLKIHI
ncbi:MAG: hypothetical protein U5J63_01610 [Fodinibius sp.]|nr:hypothetical protein [Fodinibius sp.]